MTTTKVNWLVCREPVHIGGADSSSRGNNSPIFRLPDRTPAIPGSSLRGALREGAEHSNQPQEYVNHWFGQENTENSSIPPGYISLGWGWPVWWPVHVLGYGNWWVSCPSWLNRFQQLSGGAALNFSDSKQVYITDSSLRNQTVYLRWLRLSNVQHYQETLLPIPKEIPGDRCIIVPDNSINVLVDMGLVHQPRVKLLDEPDKKGNLVENLFASEGIPPGATFLISWTTRKNAQNIDKWEKFLHSEHYLGGLWSIGYGRVAIINRES